MIFRRGSTACRLTNCLLRAAHFDRAELEGFGGGTPTLHYIRGLSIALGRPAEGEQQGRTPIDLSAGVGASAGGHAPRFAFGACSRLLRLRLGYGFVPGLVWITLTLLLLT